MHYWRNCPNCRQRIDLELALGLSGWSKIAPAKYGIRCPNCKVVLAARQRPGVAIFWALLVVLLALMFVGQETGGMPRIVVWLFGLCLVIVVVFMRRWRLRSIELSVPPRGLKLREVTPSEREYAYREGKDGRNRPFVADPDPGITTAKLPEWTCLNCKQRNPAEFDVCWKCNHGRPKTPNL